MKMVMLVNLTECFPGALFSLWKACLRTAHWVGSLEAVQGVCSGKLSTRQCILILHKGITMHYYIITISL